MRGRKFDNSLILGCIKCEACKHSETCVLICAPLTRKLTPFPTSFWLACPYLMRIAGELESGQGVKELERWLVNHNKFKEWRGYNFLHQQVRLSLLKKLKLDILNKKNFLQRFKPELYKRLRRGGLGGIDYLNNNKIYVKCLHLQLASLIALNYHPGAEWLRDNIAKIITRQEQDQCLMIIKKIKSLRW